MTQRTTTTYVARVLGRALTVRQIEELSENLMDYAMQTEMELDEEHPMLEGSRRLMQDRLDCVGSLMEELEKVLEERRVRCAPPPPLGGLP